MTCGIIVDYVNVFKYMQQALSDYASADDNAEYPAKDIEQLTANIDLCIVETEAFLLHLGIKLADIIAEGETLDQLEMFRRAYNRILEKDEWKDRFKALSNLLMNLYDAAKPEIFERGWHNEKFAPMAYLNGLFCNQIDDEKLRMAEALDQSVSTRENEGMAEEDASGQDGYGIHQSKVIDLSKLDVEALRREISTTPYKAQEIYDLLRSGRKLTKEEEQMVILAAKNLYHKLLAEKKRLMVVDWYKDEQPRHQVLVMIQKSLNDDLPMCYDRAAFNDKTNALFNHFVDMAVQGYGWGA